MNARKSPAPPPKLEKIIYKVATLDYQVKYNYYSQMSEHKSKKDYISCTGDIILTIAGKLEIGTEDPFPIIWGLRLVVLILHLIKMISLTSTKIAN